MLESLDRCIWMIFTSWILFLFVISCKVNRKVHSQELYKFFFSHKKSRASLEYFSALNDCGFKVNAVVGTRYRCWSTASLSALLLLKAFCYAARVLSKHVHTLRLNKKYFPLPKCLPISNSCMDQSQGWNTLPCGCEINYTGV